MTDEERLADFEAKIARGEKIEPKDWMPERYRAQLVRMMGQHAHGEIISLLPESNWITRAPTLRRKMSLLAKVQDEAGHALYMYSATETLGVDREALIADLLAGKVKYAMAFNYPTLTWGDVGAIGWLIDGASIIIQTLLAKSSYGPYARAMLRICQEENFHKKLGYEIIGHMAGGNKQQRRMVEDAVRRWWYPALMMFGPPDRQSANTEELMRWRIKLCSNDELRQRYVHQIVEEAEPFGLKLPNVTFNQAARRWELTELDLSEFYSVIKGNGPMNRERLAVRQDAHREGEWVRQACAAYAEKHGS